jgi:hypothetical protein
VHVRKIRLSRTQAPIHDLVDHAYGLQIDDEVMPHRRSEATQQSVPRRFDGGILRWRGNGSHRGQA